MHMYCSGLYCTSRTVIRMGQAGRRRGRHVVSPAMVCCQKAIWDAACWRDGRQRSIGPEDQNEIDLLLVLGSGSAGGVHAHRMPKQDEQAGRRNNKNKNQRTTEARCEGGGPSSGSAAAMASNFVRTRSIMLVIGRPNPWRGHGADDSRSES